jgi:hypothetical protein
VNWGNSAKSFIILMTAFLSLLGFDLYLYTSGQPTFSESIWDVNQFSLAVALICGTLIGHFFTVPKKERDE